MSNLYKQRFVVNHNDNARVINSNHLVAEKMEELAREAKKTTSNPNADGFVAGLNPESIEVVPKEENISLEEAVGQITKEAEDILADAIQKAEHILADAKVQAEELKNEARDAGFTQGLQEGSKKAEQELQQSREQIKAEQQTQELDYRQKLEELEPRLVDVVAQVFEKVFHIQFDDKKDILIYLIQNTILGIEGTKDFQVRVSTEDIKFLESHMDEITGQIGQNVNVEIMADVNMRNGQCMIETDSGIFDCGSDVQLENLIKTLRTLSL